mgnify:CR=1 FL=1
MGAGFFKPETTVERSTPVSGFEPAVIPAATLPA